MRYTGVASWFFLSASLAGSGAVGCGYSEDEMQARLHEIDGLRKQLTAEQEQSKKAAKGGIDEANAKDDQRKQELREAGIDVANLKESRVEQARALDDYRRRVEQLAVIKKRLGLFRDRFQTLTKLGLNVTVRNNRMVLELPGDALFDAGRETLKKEGEQILLKVAEVIRSEPAFSQRVFQVAGHTDNAPPSARFKDDWAFSMMRAREVLVFLVAPASKDRGGGLNPNKWSAAGFGDVDPVKSNDTPEGKQANRRCEIVLLPSVEETVDLKSLGQ